MASASSIRIKALIEASGKSQTEIAHELGYPKPNIISMAVNDKARLPIEKCKDFAKAVGAEPQSFYLFMLREYMPGIANSIEDALGHMVSPLEAAMLDTIRDASEGIDFPFTEDAMNELREWAIKHSAESRELHSKSIIDADRRLSKYARG